MCYLFKCHKQAHSELAPSGAKAAGLFFSSQANVGAERRKRSVVLGLATPETFKGSTISAEWKSWHFKSFWGSVSLSLSLSLSLA
jgi:hypothetical protein